MGKRLCRLALPSRKVLVVLVLLVLGRIFDETPVAYFVAEPDGDEWKFVRRVPDQD